jgi:arylsulfatase A-like enzyme
MLFRIPILLLALLPSVLFAKPNILVIYVDDLGYGDTAVYGHPVVQTPNIDRLASEGVRFTQFYAPSALCSPSRAGLLTGRTPYRTGIQSWIPDDSEVSLNQDEYTLAQMAKDNGYRTAVIGKWHLNGGLHLTEAPQPRDFGFDYQYGLAAWVKNEKAEKAGGGHLYPDNMFRNNEPVGETSAYSAELVTDEAINWLSADESPFFLFLTYSEVHTPVASPASYVRQYDEFLTEESRQHPLKYYMNWGGRPYRGKGEYYANVSYMDAQMGRVLEHLRKNGTLDNTLVIFSSDNGPITADAETPWELGMAGETDGLRGKKRYLFEGGIRVPGIVRWPQMVPAGLVTDEIATALDVLPTIAEVLEHDVSQLVLDGDSILPLIDKSPATRLIRTRPFYWSIPTPDGMEYAFREGNWKLILNPDGEPVYLFDLANDRYEVNNLLKPEAERVSSMLARFDEYRAEVEGKSASE